MFDGNLFSKIIIDKNAKVGNESFLFVEQFKSAIRCDPLIID